jgi:hypothetical protein
MTLRRFSSIFIAIFLLTTLFGGIVSVAATAGATSTSTAKKYITFRDDDIGYGNVDALKAINQVHIDENVPVTLAIIPHPAPSGTGNELLWDTPTNNYLQSIATNPLFEFAQHGYNHYDYVLTGATTSASIVGAGVPQVEGAAAPYYEVGETTSVSPLVGAGSVYSEFRGRPWEDQYSAINQGRYDIEQAFGVTPTTFVPPWNTGDTNTLLDCAALGFTLYSTSIKDFNVREAYLDGITVQGGTIGGMGSGWNTYSDWQIGMWNLMQQTDTLLNAAAAGEHIVIAYHFWSFEKSDTSVDPALVALYKQYIEYLKGRGDVAFTTLAGQPFTLAGQPLTQLSLTASTTTPAVGTSVTFTATLKSGTTPVSSKHVTIYHYENGGIVYDGTPTTDSNGQVTLTRSWSTTGQRTYYAIFVGDPAYKTSTSNAVNINVGQTQLSLTASTTTPTVGTSVTFTATLKSGTTPVSSKLVTIYHYENGGIVYDGTPTTDGNGQATLATSWSTTGQRTYYAIFEGDTAYKTSTSNAVNINVGQTQLSLTASTTTPTVGTSVTFTATLKSGTTPVSSKLVTIYHFENGNIIYDGTPTTDGNGQVTLATSWSTTGQRTYYAIFEGDTAYQTSTSSAVTVNVSAWTRVTLTASTTTPTVNQQVTLTATLSWLNPATGQWVTFTSGKKVSIYHNNNGVIVYDGTRTTNSNGQITYTTSWSTTGQRTYYAIFGGDASYKWSMGSATIIVH